MDNVNSVNQITEVARGISDYGFTIMAGAIFLTLAAALMIACFVWFKSIINGIISRSENNMGELLKETRTQNEVLADISEGLLPETQLRIKNLSSFAFDLATERVCRLIKRIREENHIVDEEGTKKKIRKLLTNIHEDRNSKFDVFKYHGKKLSEYVNRDWIEWVAKVVDDEIYDKSGPNNGRAYTNVSAAYEKIKLDFYHRLNA